MIKFGNQAKQNSSDPLHTYKDPTMALNAKPVVAKVHGHSSVVKKTAITADMLAGGSSGSASGPHIPGNSGNYNTSGVSGYNHDQYNVVWDKLDEGSVIEGWIPRDAVGLDALYNRIYLRDPTLGPGIDLLKNLPWSDYNLEGVNDKAIKRIYEDCMDMLQVPMLMPEITGEYLIKGRDISSLAFDERKGIFSGVLPHDPDFIKITPIQIYGYDPLCDLKLTPGFKAFLNSDDPRMVDARKSLPPAFVQAARADSGFLPLDPTSTIYLGRTASKSDYVGTSVLTRALYFWGIEKALLNSQLISVRRRARSLTHIKAGIEEKWEPQAEEMDALIAMFMQANEDPVGAVVATRNGVEVSEPQGAGQDFYKWSDELELFSKYKMQVLGISDALLSGDATYSNSESARTVFVELLANLRFRITQKFFYSKLFPTLARLHGFTKKSQAELDHNIRVNASVAPTLPAWAQASSVVTARQLSTRERMSIPPNQLLMPRIEWHKQLRPSQDMEALQMLQQLKEAGYPVTLQKWAGVAGYTTENLEDELKENQKLEKIVKKYEVKEDEDFGDEDGIDPLDEPSSDDSSGDGEVDFNSADEINIQQSLASKAKKVKAKVVASAGEIGIWKHGRCGMFALKDAERAIARIAQTNSPEIFNDSNQVVQALAGLFRGNEDKVYTTAYVMNRMGLTRIKIPVKAASKIVASAQAALGTSKNINSDKFLLALAKFDHEMRCIHAYAGGKVKMDLQQVEDVMKESSPSIAGNLGTKTLSGLLD